MPFAIPEPVRRIQTSLIKAMKKLNEDDADQIAQSQYLANLCLSSSGSRSAISLISRLMTFSTSSYVAFALSSRMPLCIIAFLAEESEFPQTSKYHPPRPSTTTAVHRAQILITDLDLSTPPSYPHSVADFRILIAINHRLIASSLPPMRRLGVANAIIQR